MELTGRTLLGKYEIEGLLGRGGMGAVWRARHALTGRKLAIKTLDEGYLDNRAVVQRFGREARAASACQHPGIVEVLDLDQTEEGIPFLVMEFLEGETLARRIERRGRLAQDEIVHLGTMLLEALEAAHAHGVIHRDLKPENIYVVPAGRRGEIVKILDFGISHKRDEAGAKLTMTGSVLGTPHYMSPEQAMGETEVDHRADVYAAGVVLYECAVGDVPFDAPNYNKLLRTILDQQPVPPRRRGAQVSAQVERLILWAMDKERERRVPSAREMLSWLERAAAGEEVPYAPPPSEVGRAVTPPAANPVRRPAGSLPLTPAGSLPPARKAALPATLGDGELSDSWRPAPLPSISSVPPPRSGEHPQRSGEMRSGEPALRSGEPALRSGEPALRSGEHALRSGEHALRSGEHALGSDELDPSSSLELELDLAVGARPSHPHGALDIDEGALRPRSIPPATGVSSAGTIASPAATTGRHSVPARVAELSGRHAPIDAPAPAPSEPAPWRRYVLVGAGALALFVGLVLAIHWVVQPGVDDAAIQGELAPEPAPQEGREPRGPSWVSVRVEGLPPSARLTLDGLPASSPVRVPNGGHHVIEISAPGYEQRRLEFDATRNLTLRANMRPAEGMAQPSP